MSIAFIKLPGLDSEKILSLVEPVLRAHRVEGVELVWRSDQHGWLLERRVERPEAIISGQGLTVDLCSEISRDISAALDLAEVIGPHYRLEVGSPGVERSLYRIEDYQRFAGQGAKLKLVEMLGDDSPWVGQRVLLGQLLGLDEQGRVVLETEKGTLSFPLSQIESAHLLFDWNKKSKGAGKGRRPSASGKPRADKRSK